MTTFIIKGRDMRTMDEVYYTGRAGTGFLSTNRADAFPMGEGEADRKARTMTRQQSGRYVFFASFASDDDAHAAGARAMSEEMCG